MGFPGRGMKPWVGEAGETSHIWYGMGLKYAGGLVSALLYGNVAEWGASGNPGFH